MKLNDFLGVFTTFCYAAPVILILFLGLFTNKSLLSLALYCVVAGIYNAMTNHLWVVDKQTLVNSVILFSYVDAPLMLGLLAMYCHTPLKKKALYTAATLYLLYEVVIAVRLGWKETSTLYTSGVGLMLVFIFGVYFFTCQLKQTIRFNKGLGRSFIAAAIFFSYGLYVIIFYVHCIYEEPQVHHVFFLYYSTSILFCVLTTVGLVYLWLRHRQIKQVKLVRRELQDFFAS